jgi:hypothetical protein
MYKLISIFFFAFASSSNPVFSFRQFLCYFVNLSIVVEFKSRDTFIGVDSPCMIKLSESKWVFRDMFGVVVSVEKDENDRFSVPVSSIKRVPHTQTQPPNPNCLEISTLDSNLRKVAKIT